MELNDLVAALEAEGWRRECHIDGTNTTLRRTIGPNKQFIDLRTNLEGDLNLGVGTPNTGMLRPRYFVVAVDNPQQAARLIWATTGALATLIQAEVCREVATGEHALYRRP